MLDIPSGTGLGSSGSFTTALLKALYAHRRRLILPDELTRLACEIEIEILKEPIGKHDQYIAAFGGITQMAKLDWVVQKRKQLAERYKQAINSLNWMKAPAVQPESEHSF